MNDITFAKLLSSVMLDNRYDRFVKNRRTGKLDTRSLFKIETSSRLFKRREARKNKDYAVSLVVDCSGSMGGSKIRMAAEAARKLSHHLAKIGINHNVVVFNAYADDIKPFSTKEKPNLEAEIVSEVQSHDGVKESRYASFMWHPKEYVVAQDGTRMMKYVGMVRGERELNRRYREAEMGLGPGSRLVLSTGPSHNSDAEALMFARKKLLKEKGTKIMIFLSDGQPACLGNSYESPINPGHHQEEFDLKKEVANTLRSGIELYSIGIESSDVKDYYPSRRTAAINDIKLLYPHIIKLIKLNLKRG